MSQVSPSALVEREEKIADFALSAMVAAIQITMGQRIPSEEDARGLVRIGRSVYAELDEPTDWPQEKEQEPPRRRQPEDAVDELFGQGTWSE